MMKNISKILAIAFVAMMFGLTAKAQSSATETGVTASATIVTPITITKVTDLAFGTVVPYSTAGTVELDPTTGDRSYTGGVTGLTSTTSSASFTVSGNDGQAYTISLPLDDDVSLIGPALSTPMTLDTWTTDIPGLTGTLTGGTQTFSVGATLNVGASQAVGSYSGTFDVTVTYE
jgi:spore coat protein U-like protein